MSLPVEKALRKAQSHIKAGQLAEAEELYKQVLSKFPKNKKAIQGYQKLKAGITSNGLASSEPPQEQIQELINLYNQGQFVKALAKAKPLIGLFPHAIHLHNIQGASHAALQRYDAAINSYDQAIKIKHDYADAYMNKGSALQNKGELDAAIESFKKTLSVNPDHSIAYFNIGNAFKEKGKIDAALESYKKALKLNPEYIEAYFNMGNILREKGNLDSALESYQRVLRIKHDHAEVLFNIGTILHEQDELDAAAQSYLQATKINPNYAEAYLGAGNALGGKGDLNAAIKSYEKVLQIKPDHAEAYSNMGNTLREKGETLAAIESYCKALLIRPNSMEIAGNLVTFPIGSLKKCVLRLVDASLSKMPSNIKQTSEFQFVEAGYLMHINDKKLAFNKFLEANKNKSAMIGSLVSTQRSINQKYFETLKQWSPNLPAERTDLLKKIFVLGPSRSGKSTLERLLKKSQKTKALFEAKRKSPQGRANQNIKFEDYFFETESDLVKKGFEVITSTNPNSIFSIIDFVEQIPNVYFVVVKRDQCDVASEIFMSDYNTGNYYAYDPDEILKYLNFYDSTVDIIKAKIPKKIKCISFEKLFENPSITVESIGDFASINFSVEVLGNDNKAFLSDSIFKSYFQKLIQT